MDSLALGHSICNFTPCGMLIPVRNPLMCGRIKKIGARNPDFVIRSKKSEFQDFQGYAKPARLLPASEVKVCTDSSLEKLAASLKADRPECLYKLTIQTSNFYGSGLTGSNAGILLCFVDETGDSILQRIAASSGVDHPIRSQDSVDSDEGLQFQMGAIDEFTFEGPTMRKIEALWIGLESGQWRPGGVSVICRSQSPSDENDQSRYGIFRYDFTVDNVLLGQGTDTSVVELRPSRVTKLSGTDIALTQTAPEPLPSSTADTMREYADLKFSLLLYDALLVAAGSAAAASFSGGGGGNAGALPFLTGGVGGFLYLVLLQRSVDGLRSPVLDANGGLDEMFGRFKGQVTTLVLVLAAGVVAVKLGSGERSLALTPTDVVLGMMGFLTSKVAVVLAAFKPLPLAAEAEESRW